MLNIEVYSDMFIKFGDNIAVVDGMPSGCFSQPNCEKCQFTDTEEMCNRQARRWYMEEYKK